MIDLVIPDMHVDFAPFEKGGWRQLHRRLGDLLLIFAGEDRQGQEQEQIAPVPLFQRGREAAPRALGNRA
jgi:hypothetical protein